MPTISTTEILAIRLLDRVRRRYGFNLQECFVAWAISEIERGNTAEEVSALASMRGTDNFFEVEDYFLKAIHALKISIPSDKEIIKKYAVSVCEKMLTGIFSEKEGCEILYDVYWDSDCDPQYAEWYNLAEDEDKISEEEFKAAVRKAAKALVAMGGLEPPTPAL